MAIDDVLPRLNSYNVLLIICVMVIVNGVSPSFPTK